MKRNEFVDFAKGLSILAIVIMHYFSKLDLPSYMRMALDFGGSGIHLFFLISGFTLFVSSYKNSLQFYKKRFRSIIIPYYVAVLIYYAISLSFPNQKHISLYELGGHLFLYKMFDSNIFFSIAFEFWYISTIIQLYLFFPLLKKLFLRFRIYFVIACGLISLVFSILLAYIPEMQQPIFQHLFIRYLWEFVLGFYLMDISKRKNIEFWNIKPIYLIAVFIVSSVLILLSKTNTNFLYSGVDDFFNSLAFVSFTIIAFQCLKKIKLSFLLVFVGSFSYYLYLLHGATLAILRKSLYDLITFNTPVVFGLLIITLIISYYLKTALSFILFPQKIIVET